MPRGGWRPGAGRKKGTKEKQTIDKEAAREALRAIVMPKLQAMVDAQVDHSMGLKYLVAREKKTGKFTRVGESKAKLLLQDGEEHIEVWEKDPSIQAFSDLMNRLMDKPKEVVEQEVSLTIQGLDARLKAARKRLDGDSRSTS